MICVSIAQISFDELMSQVSNFEMLELRLDMLDFNTEQYREIIALGKPVIATYRYGKIDDVTRVNALQELVVLGANYVDIEVDADAKFVETMVGFAQKHQCKSILSYHNFEKTPVSGELNLVIEQAKKLSADYVKIATMANTQADVSRILSLYEKEQNLIAFCMGDLGKISRVASVYLGAEFTYASISKSQETASGQLTQDEFSDIKNILK